MLVASISQETDHAARLGVPDDRHPLYIHWCIIALKAGLEWAYFFFPARQLKTRPRRCCLPPSLPIPSPSWFLTRRCCEYGELGISGR